MDGVHRAILLLGWAVCVGGCLKVNPDWYGNGDMAVEAPGADMVVEKPDLPEVLIPGGTFKMGTATDGGASNEKPEYTVTLQPYYMDVYEVTAEAYGRCVKAGWCKASYVGDSQYCTEGKVGKERHPINCVDQGQSAKFCEWMGRRLPTEEEWEYSARGGTKSEYPWGSEDPVMRACYGKQDGTCQVGSYRETLQGSYNDNGLADMAGNVNEWTSSEYLTYPGKSSCMSECVLRGGSWSSDTFGLRAAYRSRGTADSGFGYYGFRCSRNVQ